jgi:anti-anti-sigma regulatory factor
VESHQFQITRGCLSLLLPPDIGSQTTFLLRDALLKHLHLHTKTSGVIFDCTNVQLIDQQDLDDLVDLIKCIQLMGKQVGFCSIKSSLAAVLVSLQMKARDCCFGHSLDDVIDLMHS